GAAVSQEFDGVSTGSLLPGVHDEHVVDPGHGDGVDALGLDCGGVLHEARQMVLVAGRRERARHCEQHHLLALEQLVGGLRLRPLARHHGERTIGHAVANLDSHDSYPLAGFELTIWAANLARWWRTSRAEIRPRWPCRR